MLSAIIFLPLLGAVLVALVPSERRTMIRWLAGIFAGLPLLLGLILYEGYDVHAGGLQYVERVSWVTLPEIGVSYFVGVDGLSLPLIVLTALLTLVAILASERITERAKEYYLLLLILQTGVTGVFAAWDFFLFFLFWEVELVPMYLLIGIWGGPRREYAAIKFVIYTLAGSALMLVGILALYFYGTPHTFDMTVLARRSYAPAFASVVFWLLFAGFAVKLPVFPLHTWLPDAHVEAPTAVSVLLAGVLLKMGGYGMLRVLVGLLPEATRHWALPLAILAVVSVLYGACVSMVQRDLKAMVAYSSISHMGYVLLGVAAFTSISLSGAAIQLFTHGLITGLLFLLVGALYDRAHTRLIPEFSGIAKRQPLLAVLFTIGGLASLGLPSLAGFIAEFTVFIGSFAVLPVFTVLAAAGIVLTAGYLLWMLRRVYFGPLAPRWERLEDVRGVEVIPLVTLTALIILIGIEPSLLTDVINAGVASLTTSAAAAHPPGALGWIGLPGRPW
ncbi:MAG TPA: NADH-quinone oxidoreductase subunit M [Chloroflexota bacterium]|nr:NADH-quinone oxidoreductase subunit M [Chloroflexota bacterium]